MQSFAFVLWASLSPPKSLRLTLQAVTHLMFRKRAFERSGGYRAAAEKWEDVDLYLRLAGEGRILVLAEPLLRVRQTGRSTRSLDGEARLERSLALLYRAIGRYQRDGSYEELLDRPAEEGRFDPRLFISNADRARSGRGEGLGCSGGFWPAAPSGRIRPP